MSETRGVFRPGDLVQLTDPKGRHHTIMLEPGQRFHTHKGFLRHEQLIGQPEGCVVATDRDVDYVAFRPRLADYVLSMPRGAQIIYPKDAAEILQRADIGPGHTVLEAGLGSGALSLWLLRALGPSGQLLSVERRSEFAEIARANVESFFRGAPETPWDILEGDFTEVVPDRVPSGSVDRVVLDMLAPWECLEGALNALRPGGIILCYVATVTQLSRVVEALRATNRVMPPESTETLVRGWHLEGLAVRPDHRMIGHTAFLVWARKLADGFTPPRSLTTKAKPEFDEADIEVWTPGALGQRTDSDKKIRERLSDARVRATKRVSLPEQ